MRSLSLGFFICLLCATLALATQNAAQALAALTFPALTGRVVDDADVLSAGTIESLTSSLEAYENKTGNQIVVVTLPSLQGDTIDDYGYKLGRRWQIGQKGQNNGVLLIVAPAEHKVRIEVGYGAEPFLTDSLSSNIINSIILPAFRAGNMEQGILDGAQALIDGLGNRDGNVARQTPTGASGMARDAVHQALINGFAGGRRAATHDLIKGYDSGQGAAARNLSASSEPMTLLQMLVIAAAAMILIWLCIAHPQIAWFMFNVASTFSGSSSGRSGFGGGGFMGGGGSFGGGGASGSW